VYFLLRTRSLVTAGSIISLEIGRRRRERTAARLLPTMVRRGIVSAKHTNTEGSEMAIFNKDEVGGKLDQASGTVKDKVGEWTGNDRLEAEGEVQHAEGETQETWGKFKRGVSETVDSVGEAISDLGKSANK
jgi:uncharacterized protein YjbJ (UPF0337 family)